MSVEANKAKVRRFVEDGMGKGDLSTVEELVAPDEIVHDYPTSLHLGGIESAKALITRTRTAIPDLHVTVDLQIAEGDLVMTRWTGRGTHHEALMGLSGTSKPVEVTGIMIHRFRDGKSVEYWSEWDRLGFLHQTEQTDVLKR